MAAIIPFDEFTTDYSTDVSEDRIDRLKRERDIETHVLMRAMLWAFFAIYFVLNFVYEPSVIGIALFLTLNGIMEALIRFQPAEATTRWYIGFMLMAAAAFLIDVAMGATWMHFAVFTNLAFLLAYRDWQTILVAEITIAVHHLAFNYLQMWGFNVSVFPPHMLGLTMVVIHAVFVVFQCAVLFYICSKLAQNLVDRAGLEETLERVLEVKGVAQNNQKIQAEIEAVVDANKQLSARSFEQAEDVSAMRAQMSDFSEQQRNGVSQREEVSTLVGEASADARNGQQIVIDLNDSIDVLKENSKQIFGIVEVIDEIASQTNLLALNAAVQAARAGEEGRAFAVVAGEVRNLASRSADSLKQIRTMIESNDDQVDRGARLAESSGAALNQIVAGIEHIRSVMEELSNADMRQAESIGVLNRMIESIDATNQKNLTMVSSLEQSSEQLYHESAMLANRMDEALSEVSA